MSYFRLSKKKSHISNKLFVMIINIYLKYDFFFEYLFGIFIIITNNLFEI